MGCSLQKLMLVGPEFVTPLLLDEVGNRFRLFHASVDVVEN
jgi:hypothetical protein